MKPNLKHGRTIFTTIIAIGILWFFVRHGKDLRKSFVSLRHGDGEFLLTAAIMQIAYFFVFSQVHRQVYAAFKINFPTIPILRSVISSIAAGVALPGGIAGGWYFVHAAEQSAGAPKNIAWFSTITAIVIDYVAIIAVFISVAASGWLHLAHPAVAVSIVGVIVAILLFYLSQPRRLVALSTRLSNSYLVIRWPALRNRFEQFSQTVSVDAPSQPRLAGSIVIALAGHALQAMVLVFVTYAFLPSLPLDAIMGAYAAATFAWIVSPTPQGIGVVEVVIASVLGNNGVDAGVALAIGFTYRIFAFWIPLIIGAGLIAHQHKNEATQGVTSK